MLRKKTYIPPKADVQTLESIVLKIKNPILQDCVHISQQNKHWSSLVDTLDSYIKPENFLGKGIEAKVYKLNDNYVLRILNKTSSVEQKHFKLIQDVFEGKNYGQAVAASEDGMVYINRFVKGNPLYGSNWNIRKSITKDEYMRIFNEIKTLPDETFADYIKNIINIRKKGYDIDAVNPNNFLLDGMHINIVDLTKCKVKAEITFKDFNPLVNKYQLNSILKNMSQAEIEHFANKIKVFYDRMMRIALETGYEFHIPKLNHNELQDIITYLYHKDWTMLGF